jgi:hypothetical protein
MQHPSYKHVCHQTTLKNCWQFDWDFYNTKHVLKNFSYPIISKNNHNIPLLATWWKNPPIILIFELPLYHLTSIGQQIITLLSIDQSNIYAHIAKFISKTSPTNSYHNVAIFEIVYFFIITFFNNVDWVLKILIVIGCTKLNFIGQLNTIPQI